LGIIGAIMRRFSVFLAVIARESGQSSNH